MMIQVSIYVHYKIALVNLGLSNSTVKEILKGVKNLFERLSPLRQIERKPF